MEAVLVYERRIWEDFNCNTANAAISNARLRGVHRAKIRPRFGIKLTSTVVCTGG